MNSATLLCVMAQLATLVGDDHNGKRPRLEAISGLLNSEDLALNSGSRERHRMGVAFKPEQAKDF
jgi:hypothetical protein